VQDNRTFLARGLGVTRDMLVFAGQVHGSTISFVDDQCAGNTVAQSDGLVTRTVGVALVILVADCAVVGLYDPDQHAAALVHAGWRGTVAGIAGRAVRTMCTRFASNPEHIFASIGPSIGPCCYAVGTDVVDAFTAAYPELCGEIFAPPDFASAGSFPGTLDSGGAMLDLWTANTRILEREGLRRNHISVAAQCTACHTDRFYSHRAEKGQTGRFAGVMLLRAR